MKELNKCAEVAQRRSEVVEQMDSVDSNIIRLDEATRELRDRLSRVLSSKPSVSNESKKLEERTICEHANDLRGFNYRLNNIWNSLTELLQDIEL